MFALIENGVITDIVAAIPPAPDPLPEDYVAPDYRPVVEGAQPTLTTAFSTASERPMAEWTIQPTQVIREYVEHIPPLSDQVAIQAARDALPLLPKKKRVMEILQDALASETEPDFSAAGIASCPLAMVSDITEGSGLNQTQVDARVSIGTDGIFSPVTHNHDASYAALAHTHAGVYQPVGSYASATHTHAPADITGTAVVTNDARLSDARTPLAHTHVKASITDFAHTHPQSEVTNLVTDLAGKAASGHTHAGTYEPANANIQAHIVAAHAPANAQANADITKAEIEAKLTGVISSHSHSGGSDPWTVIKLAADFVTNSATAVDVTGLSFTPAANTTYAIESFLLVRTATAATGPRPGCSWPSGMTDGAVRVDVTSAAGTNLLVNGNISASVLVAAGGLPSTTGSWPSKMDGVLVAGPSPTGTFRVQLASEAAGTNVTAKAGSYLRYRTL